MFKDSFIVYDAIQTVVEIRVFGKHFDAMKGNTSISEALNIISSKQGTGQLIYLEDLSFGDSISEESAVPELNLVPVAEKLAPEGPIMTLDNSQLGASVWDDFYSERSKLDDANKMPLLQTSIAASRYFNFIPRFLDELKYYAKYSANRIDMQVYLTTTSYLMTLNLICIFCLKHIFPDCVLESQQRQRQQPKQSASTIARLLAADVRFVLYVILPLLNVSTFSIYLDISALRSSKKR